MKFRMLNADELSVLEEDLKAFLIVNGLDGSEWEKLNKVDPEKATKLVELFSDLVLEKAYNKIHFLEFRSKNMCMVFNCQEELTQCINLELTNDSTGDLSTPESIHQTLLQKASDITFRKTERKNQKSKAEEVHNLIENGCVPSIEEFWISLEKVIDLNKN